MSTTRIVILAFTLILLTAGPAAANQPPGPQLILAEVLILPLMMLLSMAGGAYAILHALQPKRKTRPILTGAAAILAILISGASGGIALVIAAIFGALALQRGVQMVWWGSRARAAGTKPAHLEKANPRRLLPAGAVLLVLTTLLMGMAVSFAAYWPVGDGPRQKAFREFVTYQLAASRQEQAKTGKARFRRIEAPGSRSASCPAFRLPAGARVEYAPNETGFTVLLVPRTPFPFFPYNYLTSQPSYRADQTGKIRMIEVHDRHTECPSDAPIVAEVTEGDVQRMLELLEGLGDCP